MPTVNQLVRKGRKKVIKKTKTSALGLTYNALKNKMLWGKSSPQKRGDFYSGGMNWRGMSW
ncbi:unnamed protein product [marine sediment metagenome]|uniref:30S ribosomal protein S12 n=1 Tax=marine sediment metagenome TaxID=412755 RepID=X1S988_9ZZZZ